MIMFQVLSQKVWPRPGGGKAVLAHPVSGLTNRILVASGTGAFLVQHRDPDDDGVRRWWRYEDVWSLQRGLALAREKTLVQRIPTLEELQTICRRVHVQLCQRMVDAATLHDVQQKLRHVLRTLRCPKTRALKAVVTQVECVLPLRDSRGRLNLGALAARLVPVKERLFCERIADIAGWLTHYARWEQDVAMLQELAGGQLPRLEAVLGNWIARLSDIANWRFAVPRMLQEIAVQQDQIAQLQPFGGWTNWARACATDFSTARASLCHGQRDTALDALRRLQVSVRLKRLQADLSELLLHVQQDDIGKVARPAEYRVRIAALLATIAAVDDGNLRHPVSDQLIGHLRAAEQKLCCLPMDEKQFRAGCDRLRAACRLL